MVHLLSQTDRHFPSTENTGCLALATASGTAPCLYSKLIFRLKYHGSNAGRGLDGRYEEMDASRTIKNRIHKRVQVLGIQVFWATLSAPVPSGHSGSHSCIHC